MATPPEYLSPLNAQPGVCADFTGRIDGVSVDTDRAATVARLQPSHEKYVGSLGFSWADLHLAEQVHGSEIAIISDKVPPQVWPQVDGLMVQAERALLGIYVADCGAVYVVDPVRHAIALLHSGKKGTEKNITGKAIEMMHDQYGSQPSDLIVVLAPCIRPPAYEVDFAAEIREQAIAAGVPAAQYHDSGICTAENVADYYSYRLEKGSTGRMLALLGLSVK